MKNLIDVKNVVIGADSVQAVSARELYLELGYNESKWHRWNKRNIINNAWFDENRDWVKLDPSGYLSKTGQTPDDFAINLRFAQHIAMMARTLKGHEYRNYLIDCEKSLAKLSTDDEKMLRLTRISPNTLKAITGNRSNNEVRKGYIGLTQGGYLVDAGKWVWKHNYQPTEKGLECVKAVKHGILHFKPEYHDALMETVANYTAQLTNDNTDLFLEA
jgi:phage anti-repressor protein